MNINIFFVIIASGLLMIFFLFKPLDIKQQKFIDVPLFQLDSFNLHELNQKGLSTLMSGTNATRYSDRYTVKDIDYTDNSRTYIANMKASDGIYKNEIVEISGNVVYTREDGLTFQTQSAVYNKKTKIAYTDKDYVSYRNDDRVEGTSLKYNNLLGKAYSTNVVAVYQLQEDE
ncbi:LPS export ABC transporter periplasmic protein LptC [bacterium]|nr:LPS export ABC transporter periplasmic protein LptC [bacterium]MBU1990349.1 LPS export ABC transporter periplasmic protein LptC [bacterium]